MREKHTPTHIPVGDPAPSKKPPATLTGQPLQQQVWSLSSLGDIQGLSEILYSHESSFPIWGEAFYFPTDHRLSDPIANSDHQGRLQQRNEGYSACHSASYPWAYIEQPRNFADIFQPIHDTTDSYGPCFPPCDDNLYSSGGEVLGIGPGLGESYVSGYNTRPVSPSSWAQFVNGQSMFEHGELCTGFNKLNDKSLLCQEAFFSTRQDSHILPEVMTTTPRSYRDNFGSELPVSIEPEVIMLSSYDPVFFEGIERLDLHTPCGSRRNSFTQHDVLPSHFVYSAPEDTHCAYRGNDDDLSEIRQM